MRRFFRAPKHMLKSMDTKYLNLWQKMSRLFGISLEDKLRLVNIDQLGKGVQSYNTMNKFHMHVPC